MVKTLTDEQVHDRLVAAADTLGADKGETVRGDTAMTAARRALVMFQLALVMAMERESDALPGYTPPADP